MCIVANFMNFDSNSCLFILANQHTIGANYHIIVANLKLIGADFHNTYIKTDFNFEKFIINESI